MGRGQRAVQEKERWDVRNPKKKESTYEKSSVGGGRQKCGGERQKTIRAKKTAARKERREKQIHFEGRSQPQPPFGSHRKKVGGGKGGTDDLM